MTDSSGQLHSRLRHAGPTLATLRRALGMAWSAAPIWTAAWLGLLLAQGVLPVASVFLSRPLVDALARAIAAGPDHAGIATVLGWAAMLGATLLLSEALSLVAAWVRTAQEGLIGNTLDDLIQARSATVDLAFYESPAFFDRLHRARDDAAGRQIDLLESLGALVQHGLTLGGMGLLLLRYGLWVPLALVVSTAPAFYLVFRHNRRFHQWWLHTTAERRRADYYDALLTDQAAAAEVRLFGLDKPVRAAYQLLRGQLLRARLSLSRAQLVAQLLSGALALAVTAGAALWMILRALAGAVSLGDVVLFYQAFERGQSLLREVLGSAGRVYVSFMLIEDLFAFLDLRPQIADPPEPAPVPLALRSGVRFRSVGFRYPGSAHEALCDFDLELPAGQLVAIVGANGAGKSTLLKLLCRFYEPTSGVIEIDGLDLRRFALADLRRMITVLFQHPVAYQGSAAKNIALSSLEADTDQPVVEAAARAAGVHNLIAGLPHGYATHLGTCFEDGVELSGGEWQRVALARAFLRPAPILILDEPTSFMDAWAEARWLERLRELLVGRTGLLITHRFTTAMRADIIYVMDHGRILEAGSHAELLAYGGRYAEGWATQAGSQPGCLDTLARTNGLRLR